MLPMIRSARRIVPLLKPHSVRICSAGAQPPPVQTPRKWAGLAGIGLFGGCFGSLAGVGGGVVIVPMLVSALRMSQHQANATSMASILGTGAVGTVSYARAGYVDWTAAATLATLGAATTHAGVRLAQRIPGHRLKRMLGVFVLLAAPLVPIRGMALQRQARQRHEECNGAPQSVVEEDGRASLRLFTPGHMGRTLFVMALGAVGGLCSGLFGIGGGIIVTNALGLALDVPQQLILGTSLAAMIPGAAIGTITHRRLGNLVLAHVPALFVGTSVGALLGSSVALHVPDTELRWVFAAFMTCLGTAMVVRG